VKVLDPLGLLAAFSAVAIVALYFLKARRPKHVVASTMWWQPLLLDRQAATPWQRLRPSWLLALQLLVAGLLVIALVQPALATAQALTGQTIVIIDTSETMQSADVPPSRFEVALSDARALVGKLGPRARMTLIAMDQDPVILADGDGQRSSLLSVLARLRPTNGPADLQQALQLAAAVAGPHPAAARLVILSDGITEPLGEPVDLPFAVQYRRIGVSNENAGVTALTIVPGPAGESAVAHVQDFGQEAVHLTAEMAADGRLAAAQAVELPAGGGQDVSFLVPPGTSYVRVSLVPGDDLAVDDSAVAVTSPPGRLRILLVSAGDLFLQDALSLRPDVDVSAEAPSRWSAAQASGPGVGLFVFDGFVPKDLPPFTPYLLVGPPADQVLGTGPPLAPGPLVAAEANDPLLYDVDLSGVDTALSTDLQSSHFGRVVISSTAGPVLMVRDGGPSEPPAALLGIYLHDSDLVLRSAFPVLLTNLSEYLAPGLVPEPGQSPGVPVTLTAGAGSAHLVVTQPDGSTDVLATGTAVDAGTVLFSGTSEVGIYRVTVVEHRGPDQVGYLAVNASATSIAPQQSLDVTGHAGQALATSRSYQDLWPFLVVMALLVLLVEWLVYHRAA
jgi:Ca-activated chloride channel homolog